MSLRSRRAARRAVIRRLARAKDGKLLPSREKMVCGLCKNRYPVRDIRLHNVCPTCRRTPEGVREVARLAAEKRRASMEAALLSGAERLPDEESFTPLQGEAIVAKWQREWCK